MAASRTYSLPAYRRRVTAMLVVHGFTRSEAKRAAHEWDQLIRASWAMHRSHESVMRDILRYESETRRYESKARQRRRWLSHAPRARTR